MAFDKNSNAFTFGFAIVMVVVVGAVLSGVSLGLKEKQQLNDDIKKKMDILGALNVECTRENAIELYDRFITDSYVINSKGEKTEGEALAVDIKKDFRDRSLPIENKRFPLYVSNKDGQQYYVVPMVGTGLWGPVWGFVALEGDFATIYGAKFDHKTETPGLGAEIREVDFQKKFYEKQGKKKINFGSDKLFEIMKGGSVPTETYQVDGITGGTITSKGVEEMLIRTLKLYELHFNTIKI